MESPANILSVDEVPLERLQVENVQVQRVGFDAVQLAIHSFLGLPLVKVALGPGFAV